MNTTLVSKRVASRTLDRKIEDAVGSLDSLHHDEHAAIFFLKNYCDISAADRTQRYLLSVHTAIFEYAKSSDATLDGMRILERVRSALDLPEIEGIAAFASERARSEAIVATIERVRRECVRDHKRAVKFAGCETPMALRTAGRVDALDHLLEEVSRETVEERDVY